MEVQILTKKVELPITSVTLRSDYGNNVRMFFCYNCRNSLFQYIGKVISITPGSTPYSTPILLMCLRCKTTYQIIDIL